MTVNWSLLGEDVVLDVGLVWPDGISEGEVPSDPKDHHGGHEALERVCVWQPSIPCSE